jgi:hypothetical protein
VRTSTTALARFRIVFKPFTKQTLIHLFVIGELGVLIWGLFLFVCAAIGGFDGFVVAVHPRWVLFYLESLLNTFDDFRMDCLDTSRHVGCPGEMRFSLPSIVLCPSSHFCMPPWFNPLQIHVNSVSSVVLVSHHVI